jgi:hypothetical protein
MLAEHAREMLSKSARVVARHKQALEQLRAEGADTIEAERLLGHLAAAHLMFENCFRRAATEQVEVTARGGGNMAGSR